MKQLGSLLFNVLFDDGLQTNFLEFYDEVVHNKRGLLRLELDFDEEILPSVAALPWEFLFVPQNKVTGEMWLATSPNVVLSRRRARWTAAQTIQLALHEKLRIAVVVANPTDEHLGIVDYKKLYQELQVLSAELHEDVTIELVDPEQHPATRDNIDKVLEREPHIFHFVGHGRFNEAGGQIKSEIAVVRESGRARWVDAGKFSQLFARHRPDIVFLQACEGGQLSSSRAFAGVASQIVQQNIPVVVAMQYEITNATARKFAREFYRRLAADDPVDAAVQEGRSEISDWHETRDFASPVLFMRVRDGRLFETEKSPLPRPIPGDGLGNKGKVIDLTTAQRTALKNKLVRHFNVTELEDFCFDLGLNHENFPNRLSGFARELISYCERHARLDQFLALVRQRRPQVEWP
jgi:hypothetical protein